MSKIIIILLLSVFTLFAKTTDKEIQKFKLKEYETLKSYVELARDSLQKEIANRWRNRQAQVEQREHDKEDLNDMRDKVERVHTEHTRLTEIQFSLDGAIDDASKQLNSKQEEWKFLATTIDEVLEREGDGIVESFPVDMEEKKLSLEEIRRSFNRSQNGSVAISRYFEFKDIYITRGISTSIDKRTIIPNSGDSQDLTYVRFGNIFAYGLNSSSEAFVIRQTGSLGADRYSIDKLEESPLNDFILAKVPSWIEKQTVTGLVLMDVLQNSQSKILISGEKLNTKQKLFQWFKSGGPIMYPLVVMFGWAIILMILKIIQFITKSGSNKKLSKVVMDYLGKNDVEGAKKFTKNRKGVVAQVVKTCLEHSRWNRTSAEKAVKEILIEELPAINKHLNTLAVIAGAAPLMGLLGTVTGMISLFEVITNYGTGDPKVLAGGISEALVTTEVGLIIAIPILLAHNFLRNRTNDLQSEMEKHAIKILNRLWPENSTL